MGKLLTIQELPVTRNTLESALESANDPLEVLSTPRPFPGWVVEPDEYTNWKEEQKAWRETCALRNHVGNHTFKFEGPDARALLSDFGVNDLSSFEVGQAKQYIACNPDGYLIGDSILFHLGENQFGLTGLPTVADWLRYNLDRGEYDATANFEDAYLEQADPENREYFRYSIQGPNATNVMEKVVDGSLPTLPFFNFDDVTVDGKKVTLFHHGMAGEKGFEFWGPIEHGDEIWDTFVEAGEEFKLRQLGNLAYQEMALETGWVSGVLPAIFDDDERLRGYREQLNTGMVKSIWSPGGSYNPESISDFYLEPAELGYGKLVDFNHDFMGKEALEEKNDQPDRRKVTLVWDVDDVVDVFRSSFEDGETYRYMEFPTLWSTHSYFNEVKKDRSTIGVSKFAGYTANERALLSLAVLDREYIDPGTEVTVVWGEARNNPNPTVESHVLKDIRATVAPAPYVPDRHGRSEE